MSNLDASLHLTAEEAASSLPLTHSQKEISLAFVTIFGSISYGQCGKQESITSSNVKEFQRHFYTLNNYYTPIYIFKVIELET